ETGLFLNFTLFLGFDDKSHGLILLINTISNYSSSFGILSMYELNLSKIYTESFYNKWHELGWS
ncbi:hypothetical protein ACJX0J_033050, partial [Zea mays]